MRNARIAFVCTPHASHINPTLSIVSVLARRGHHVTYVTSDRFAPTIEAAGAQVFSGLPLVRGEPLLELLSRIALQTVDDAASFYAHKPELIIYDFISFAGRILAQRWGIPAIQISPDFAYERSSLHLQLTGAELKEGMLVLSKEVDTFLRLQGVDSDDWLYHRERLNIHSFPREFEPSQQAVADERNLYAGRCAAEAPQYGRWKNGNIGKPIVLVSTSTTDPRGTDYFKMCIAALVGLDWHVILSIGELDPAQLMPLPPQFEIIQGVSHTQIYPYAALVFFAGGTTSSAEAAYHGVPSIVTSCGNGELEGLGDNIERLGFGRHIKKNEMSVTRLREVALEVTHSPQIHDNMSRLMRSVRSAPGGEETANRIEDYLDEQRAL